MSVLNKLFEPVSNFNFDDPADWKEIQEVRDVIADIITTGMFTPDMPKLMEMSHHYVFVYGTLKKGFHNYKTIMGYDCVGVGFTDLEKFSMMKYTRGNFPVAMIDPSEKTRGRIYGELYEIDAEGIRSLDYLESNGMAYRRMPLMINFYNKDKELRTTRAWTYIGLRDYWARRQEFLKPLKRHDPNNGDAPYYLYSKADY